MNNLASFSKNRISEAAPSTYDCMVHNYALSIATGYEPPINMPSQARTSMFSQDDLLYRISPAIHICYLLRGYASFSHINTHGISLLGISIQNATFAHAISLPRGDPKIETQLTLSRPSQSSDFSLWSQFRIFVLENGSYIESCSGFMRAIVDSQDRDRIVSSGPWTRDETAETWIARVNQACDGPEQDPYDANAENAVRYGPKFQNLEHMRISSQGDAVAQVNTESCKLKSLGTVTPSHTVHPATLDGLAQPLLQAHTSLFQDREFLPTMVPVQISSMWIDCSNGNAMCEGKLNVAARCSFRGFRGGSADVVATAVDSKKPLIYMSGLETKFISSIESVKTGQKVNPRFLCTKLVWKPDLSTMSHEKILHYCIQDRPRQEGDAVQNYQSLMIAILCFVHDVLGYIDEHPDMALKQHLQAMSGG